MIRDDLLHLDLYLTVSGIDIIKLFLATLPEILSFRGIEIFVHMEYRGLTGDKKAETVPTGILKLHFLFTIPYRWTLDGRTLISIFLQELPTQKDDRTKIEIITQRSLLIIDNRMMLPLAFTDLIIVGIDNTGIRLFCHSDKPLKGIGPPCDGSILQE